MWSGKLLKEIDFFYYKKKFSVLKTNHGKHIKISDSHSSGFQNYNRLRKKLYFHFLYLQQNIYAIRSALEYNIFTYIPNYIHLTCYCQNEKQIYFVEVDLR